MLVLELRRPCHRTSAGLSGIGRGLDLEFHMFKSPLSFSGWLILPRGLELQLSLAVCPEAGPVTSPSLHPSYINCSWCPPPRGEVNEIGCRKVSTVGLGAERVGRKYQFPQRLFPDSHTSPSSFAKGTLILFGPQVALCQKGSRAPFPGLGGKCQWV